MSKERNVKNEISWFEKTKKRNGSKKTKSTINVGCAVLRITDVSVVVWERRRNVGSAVSRDTNVSIFVWGATEERWLRRLEERKCRCRFLGTTGDRRSRRLEEHECKCRRLGTTEGCQKMKSVGSKNGKTKWPKKSEKYQNMLVALS